MDEEDEVLSPDDVRKMLQKGGGKLKELEPLEFELEIPEKLVTKRDTDYAAGRMGIKTLDERQAAARRNARRSHMLRKLKGKFELYTPFTPAEAAKRCNLKQLEAEAYLRAEATFQGSLIEETDDGRFQITSDFYTP